MKIDTKIGSIEIEGEFGVNVLYMPAQYMSDNASVQEREAYMYFKRVMSEIELGKTKNIILPTVFDDVGNRLFEYVQPTVTFIIDGDVCINSEVEYEAQEED